MLTMPLAKTATAGCHIRGNLTWMLDDYMPIVYSQGRTNRCSIWSTIMEFNSFSLLFLDPVRFLPYALICSRSCPKLTM
jgi:hypothetical protein